MRKYKLELLIEAQTPEEAADKLYNELVGGPDNLLIQVENVIEVED